MDSGTQVLPFLVTCPSRPKYLTIKQPLDNYTVLATRHPCLWGLPRTVGPAPHSNIPVDEADVTRFVDISIRSGSEMTKRSSRLGRVSRT